MDVCISSGRSTEPQGVPTPSGLWTVYPAASERHPNGLKAALGCPLFGALSSSVGMAGRLGPGPLAKHQLFQVEVRHTQGPHHTLVVELFQVLDRIATRTATGFETDYQGLAAGLRG